MTPSTLRSRALRVEALEERCVPATLVALTTTRDLLTFDSANPNRIASTVRITGIPASQRLLGIDYRPSTGLLYTSTPAALYSVDTVSGAATLVKAYASTAVNPVAASGFDFNPVPDRLRVAANTGDNLRINPEAGVVLVDGDLAFAGGDVNAGQTPNVVGSAYTNPDNDANTGTTLYGIDYVRDILVVQNPPNDGTLNTVGPLGVNVSAAVGFDIGLDGTAYFSTGTPNNANSVLYTVDLTTGQATVAGRIGLNKLINGLTVVLPSTPVFAVTTANRLVTFNAPTPEILTSDRAITGLMDGENVVGIDFRPNRTELLAATSAGRLLVINPVTGSTLRVNATPFAGGQFGFDVNPVPDAVRVVSDAQQNLRIVNGGRGAVNNDQSLNQVAATPNVVGVAYTNNMVGATMTTLYGIDSVSDSLVLIGGLNGTPSPNGGLVTPVGLLNLAVDQTLDRVGFDIAANGTAYLAAQLTSQTVARFYTVDLTTGGATAVVGRGAAVDTTTATDGIIGGAFGGSPLIVGMTVAPPELRRR